jgi:hypothetical protein
VVTAIEGTTVTVDGGPAVSAKAVVATEGPSRRAAGLPDPGSRPKACVYFGADCPRPEPAVMLDADVQSASDVAIMSNVAPGYAGRTR